MRRQLVVHAVSSLFVLGLCAGGCGESRYDKLKREQDYANAGEKEGDPLAEIEKLPPHPTRDALAPVLEKIYGGVKIPNATETELDNPENTYEVTAGVLAVIRLRPGLSESEKVKAIIKGTAVADGWVHQPDARRDYADHIHRVMRSFGQDQADEVLDAYGELKLLDFFNGEAADDAIAQLSGSMQSATKEMQSVYVNEKDKIWDRWMGVKMYARREVAGDQPFKTVLRDIRKDLGQAEPTPLSWEEAHDSPFKAWANAVNGNAELFAMVTNFKELREQEDFRGDTHAMWVMADSPLIPEKARKVKPDKSLGFGVYREDLGGGYQEMTFVFSKKLNDRDLKWAYLRSHIYRHIFADFATLSAAGGDFKEGIVPDKYDPAYAKCGSEAAMDAMVASYKDKYPVLGGLKPSLDNEEKIMERVVKCIIAECSPEIKNPDPDDEKDVEGPAPGSRLAFFQMLARFQNIDVDLNEMRKDPPKSQDILDAEAFLKANRNEQQ
jgi:hypothetical protein